METEKEWHKRYSMIIKNLRNYMDEGIELICLQELTLEFVQLAKSFLKEYGTTLDKPRYWFVYMDNVFKQGVLVNIDKCSYRIVRNDLHKINKHHKIQTLLIHQHYPEKVFYLANVHFSGDLTPEGTISRQDIIMKIVDLYENYSREPKPLIIVGDFNDDLKKFTKEFQSWLTSKHLIFDPSSKKYITSYHRYDYEINNIEESDQKDSSESKEPKSRLKFKGLTSEPYKTLDHFLHTQTAIKIDSLKVEPPKGLKDLEVPYTHKMKKKEIVNEPNFDTWPSDHTMMVYNISFGHFNEPLLPFKERRPERQHSTESSTTSEATIETEPSEVSLEPKLEKTIKETKKATKVTKAKAIKEPKATKVTKTAKVKTNSKKSRKIVKKAKSKSKSKVKSKTKSKVKSKVKTRAK
jgi:endonuclease/exonuclease/phosphatase family metal-dependent hydrolase